MLSPEYDYISFDEPGHRLIVQSRSWDRKNPLIIFDELHKMNKWKQFLKGVYDTEGIPPSLVVTASARMDAYPEPFLENDLRFYKRWKRSHLDVILRQDLIDLTSVTDIQSIETLLEPLKKIETPVEILFCIYLFMMIV